MIQTFDATHWRARKSQFVDVLADSAGASGRLAHVSRIVVVLLNFFLLIVQKIVDFILNLLLSCQHLVLAFSLIFKKL
jgi:hypothetical protein